MLDLVLVYGVGVLFYGVVFLVLDYVFGYYVVDCGVIVFVFCYGVYGDVVVGYCVDQVVVFVYGQYVEVFVLYVGGGFLKCGVGVDYLYIGGYYVFQLLYVYFYLGL